MPKRAKPDMDGENDKNKKRKTSRACLHCQKSHITCDEGRPCQSCIKKGIASSCRDGKRKKAKYLADVYHLLQTDAVPESSRLESQNSPSNTSQFNKQAGSSSDIPLTPPEGFSAINITSTSTNNIITRSIGSQSWEPWKNDDVQLSRNDSKQLFGSEAANQEYSILSNILKTTSEAFLSQSSPSSFLTDEEGDNTSTNISMDLTNQNGTKSTVRISDIVNSRDSDGAKARGKEADAGLFDTNGVTGFKDPELVYKTVTAPYRYTHEFHGLFTYLKSRLDQKHLLNVARAMAAYRPSFIASTKRLKEQDLIFMEQCFQRTLIDFEKIIAASGTPTAIWRRTGKIVAVGEEFCLLTEWPKSKLISDERFIVELMDNSSVSDYFDVFSRLAFGDSRGVTMTECTLLKPSGKKLQTACTWTVRRDVFDIPMMVIGNFLPIHD